MANADEVYELLSRIAAVTQEPLTYGHLEGITGVPGHFQGSMLKAVQKKCAALGEPDLSTLIVDSKTREVSPGNGNPDPAAERRRCYEFYSRR